MGLLRKIDVLRDFGKKRTSGLKMGLLGKIDVMKGLGEGG